MNDLAKNGDKKHEKWCRKYWDGVKLEIIFIEHKLVVKNIFVNDIDAKPQNSFFLIKNAKAFVQLILNGKKKDFHDDNF